VVWPQNHSDSFHWFGLKTSGDGFLQFGLKTGATVSSGLASKSAATVFSHWDLGLSPDLRLSA
jgi:hypothetical protein